MVGQSRVGDQVPSVENIIQSGCVEVCRKQQNKKRCWVRTPLAPCFIEVNINGSFLVGSGRGGIERVFRDSDSRVLLQFGTEVSVDSVVHAEVLALRGGLLVVVASWWAMTHSFVFESTCKSVVALVMDPLLAP